MRIAKFLAVKLIEITRNGEHVCIKTKITRQHIQLTKRVHFYMQTKFNVNFHKLDQ